MEKECCSYGANTNKKGALKGQGVARVGMKIICNVEGKCCAPQARSTEKYRWTTKRSHKGVASNKYNGNVCTCLKVWVAKESVIAPGLEYPLN